MIQFKPKFFLTFFISSVANLSQRLLYSLSECPLTFINSTLCFAMSISRCFQRSSFFTADLLEVFQLLDSHCLVQPSENALHTYAESHSC